MKYKANVFSLLIIAGILGYYLIDENGKAMSSDFEKSGGEVNINSKNDMRWEDILLSHTVSPFKKCFTSLFFERVKPIFLFRASFGLYFKAFLPSPAANIVFDQISINAP